MTYNAAVARANSLRNVLLSYGVKAVTIELVEGRGGSGWSAENFVATMGHHIATYRTQGLTPGLKVVKFGRSDLPGPLCNGYGGFDEVARIICMGWANHPGQGGPYTVEAGTIPKDNGRPYLFGWEFEGGMVESDFTPSYRVFMARCLAASLDWLNRTQYSHLEHKTWAPTRKVDRLGYTLAEARAEIVAQGEQDMTPEQEATLNKLVAVEAQLKAMGSSLDALVPMVRVIRALRDVDNVFDDVEF